MTGAATEFDNVSVEVVTPPSVSFTAYLHGVGSIANPSTLLLDAIAPTSATTKYKDSPAVNFQAGNPWKEVGTWSASPALTEGQLASLGDLSAWLGLKNSDDIGTQFDLRAEVYKNTALVAVGETRCITGITRNPSLAKEVAVSFAPFAPVDFDGAADVLKLRVLTRIGTNSDGTKCAGPGGSHNNAVGLRLYFDQVNRDSQFATTAP
jgi:hypothetical protein